MDVVHDTMSIIAEEEDRISSLPDDIILRILSFLDMKYVVQTSALSRKWKQIWTSMPNINLNSRTFPSVSKFAKFVNHALSHRNNGMEVSTVDLMFTGLTTQLFVQDIVNYAYLHNVRRLTMTCVTRNWHEVPRYLFSSHTLKHLTLNDVGPSMHATSITNLNWDLPLLETLSLSNMRLGDRRDKSLNVFSKCVNLTDVTLHRVYMYGLQVFNVCCPKLSNLTITNVVGLPKNFNLATPQLENLTIDVADASSPLQLSTNGFDSIEKVNLSIPNHSYNKEKYVSMLLSLFEILRSVKILILNGEIIETLSSNMDQLSHEPCPFNNLKCVKIAAVPLYRKHRIAKMAIRVKDYLLNNSPCATFVMELPQKRSSDQVHTDEMAKKVVKLEEKEQMQDEVIAKQRAILEAATLQQTKVMPHIIKRKVVELKVQVESGNPDYKVIHSIGCDIKSFMDLIPESLRVATKAQFCSQYEELKSLFLTCIDSDQWAKIKTELGDIMHYDSTRSNKNTQSSSSTKIVFS